MKRLIPFHEAEFEKKCGKSLPACQATAPFGRGRTRTTASQLYCTRRLVSRLVDKASRAASAQWHLL